MNPLVEQIGALVAQLRNESLRKITEIGTPSGKEPLQKCVEELALAHALQDALYDYVNHE